MCQKQILSASVVLSGATLHKNKKSNIVLHQMCHQTPVLLLIHLIASVENQKTPKKNQTATVNEAAPLSSMNSHQKIPCLSALGVIWPSGAQWVRPTRPGPEEVPQLPLPHCQTFNKGRFALIRRESSISYPDFSLLFVQYTVPTEHKHFNVSVIITVLMATEDVPRSGPGTRVDLPTNSPRFLRVKSRTSLPDQWEC